MFPIRSVIGITGVEIWKSQNVQNQQQFWKVTKHFKCDKHNERTVGNDDLNNVHSS